MIFYWISRFASFTLIRKKYKWTISILININTFFLIKRNHFTKTSHAFINISIYSTILYVIGFFALVIWEIISMLTLRTFLRIFILYAILDFWRNFKTQTTHFFYVISILTDFALIFSKTQFAIFQLLLYASISLWNIWIRIVTY